MKGSGSLCGTSKVDNIPEIVRRPTIVAGGSAKSNLLLASCESLTTCIEFMDVSNFSCPGDTLTCCLTQVWDAGLQFWQPIDASTSIATTTVIPAKLFPVPARDHLNVRGDFEWMRIIDMSGRVLLESVQNSAIDVSHVPEGFYVVEIMSSKAKHTETIQILR